MIGVGQCSPMPALADEEGSPTTVDIQNSYEYLSIPLTQYTPSDCDAVSNEQDRAAIRRYDFGMRRDVTVQRVGKSRRRRRPPAARIHKLVFLSR